VRVMRKKPSLSQPQRRLLVSTDENGEGNIERSISAKPDFAKSVFICFCVEQVGRQCVLTLRRRIGVAPFEERGSMCARCDDIDARIIRYRRIASQVTDQVVQEGLARLLEKMLASLHPT